MATSSKSYFLTRLTPCKELNRKPNLFLYNDRPLLVLKAEDDIRCSMRKFFLGNSNEGSNAEISGLRIQEHFLKRHISVVCCFTNTVQEQTIVEEEHGNRYMYNYKPEDWERNIKKLTLSSDFISFFPSTINHLKHTQVFLQYTYSPGCV